MSGELRGRALVTLSPETFGWACSEAEVEHRSLSNFLAHIIEQYRAKQGLFELYEPRLAEESST